MDAATNFWATDTAEFNDTVDLGAGPILPTTTAVNILGGNVNPGIVSFNNSSLDYTISSTDSSGIAGAGSLIKNGTGSVTINTANSYTGSTSLNAGTLVLGSTGSLSSTAITVASAATFNLDGTLAGTPLTVSASATFAESVTGVISGSTGLTTSGTTTLAGNNTRTGTTTLNAGTLNLNSATALGSGAVTINGGTIDNTSGSAKTLSTNNTQSWNGNFAFAGSNALNLGTGAVTLSANRTLTTNGSAALTVGGVIGGSASLTKDGAGILTLTAINTYNGGTTVNGGTLNLNTGGATGAIRGTLNINSGATVALNSSDALGYNTGGVSVDTININGGTLHNTAGNQGFITNVILTGGSMTSTGGAYNFKTGFGISSAASATSSLISAPVAIRDGTLAIAVATGTTPSGTDLEISGVIRNDFGTFGMTKTGTGRLVLSGANTYGGATTINAGILAVNGSLDAASAVTVNLGGTLGGSGTVAGTVAVNNAGTLAAGNSPGTLTVGGATTFNDGSIFSWDISSNGASYDKLISAGGLVDGETAGGSVFQIVASDATFADSFWASNQTWGNIFTTDGSTAISNWANLFSVAVVNSTFSPITPVNGSFTVTGSTLSWSAVPEPSSALASLLLAAGLFRRNRRQR